nr:MAG TPA: hypothetical protein [Bacteriophage sp.]
MVYFGRPSSFFLFFLRVFMVNTKYTSTKYRHDVLCVYGGHHG